MAPSATVKAIIMTGRRLNTTFRVPAGTSWD
jgi:hypothetical protein